MKRPFPTFSVKFSFSWRASNAAVAVRRKVWLSSLKRNLLGLWLCVALSSEMSWVVSADSVFQRETVVKLPGVLKPDNVPDGVCCSY